MYNSDNWRDILKASPKQTFSEYYSDEAFEDIIPFQTFHDLSGNGKSKPETLKLPRKITYGKGKDSMRLKKLPHYGEKYAISEMYKMLNSPTKNHILKIREMYNKVFKDQINKKEYPKFKKDYIRRMDLAIGFLEDNKEIFIPFLTKVCVLK